MNEEAGCAEQGHKEMPCTSAASAPLSSNDSFNREQTLFLIDLMRQKREADGGEIPKNLAELNARVKMGKGSKKLMGKEVAAKLSDHFKLSFEPDRVARKWATLEEAYKKVKDNNCNTNKGQIHFQYYDVMEELLGGHHYVEFPVVGTADGTEIQRPDLLFTDNRQTNSPPAPSRTVRGNRSEGSGLLEFLCESEYASQRRHDELLNQMRASKQFFEDMMKCYLEKTFDD